MELMELNDISEHQIRVALALRETRDRWVTNAEIAEMAGVAPRTARNHTARLVRFGVIDKREVHPGFRFRLAEKSPKTGRYWLRLAEAQEALGLQAQP